MGIFSFTKKDKKAASNGDQSAGLGGKRFLLHATPFGWQSYLQHADGSLEKPAFWNGIHVQGGDWERMEAILKNAVANNAKTIKQAKKISLLIDGIPVQVTDNKPKALVAASGATARQFGQQWLNAKEVTYGYADLPPFDGTTEKKHNDGVYAFADARVMRSYLALFDKEGTKITDAIPAEYIMIRRATLSGESVYGALHMSGLSSKLVLLNHSLGIVMVHKIPVGLLTLVQAVAEAMGVQVQDAAQEMTQKDWISEVIPTTPDDTTAGPQNQSLYAQALQKPLTLILDNIKESLAFFAFQKVGGSPRQLELFGAIEQVTGLTEWLHHFSGMPMNICEKSMLELFSQIPHPVGCNILKGAENNLLTIGRTKFFFVEDKGFVSGQLMASQQTLVKKHTGKPGRPGSHKQKQHQRKTTGGGFLESLLGGNTQPDTAEHAMEEAGRGQERAYFAIFFLFVCAVLYWAYSEYETVANQYKTKTQAYLAS